MERQPDQSRHLIDPSKLSGRQGKKLAASSGERIGKLHQWETLAVGRVCNVCMATQANDELDDKSACPQAS